MKGRPKRIRKITGMPAVSGFIPYGKECGEDGQESVFLLFEEYEALKLADYEMCNQERSAEIMEVSRPTFTRIYRSARSKVAKAFVEGRRIIVEGGKVVLDGNWYVCGGCGAVFSVTGASEPVCALCGSPEVERYVPEGNE